MPRNGEKLLGLYPVARWLLCAQLLAGAILAAMVCLVWGLSEAKSVGVGVLVGFLPNAYFATRFGVRRPGRSAKEVVRSFYVGETTKLLMTAALFALAFQMSGINFGFLFTGFVLVVSISWFALLVRGIQ